MNKTYNIIWNAARGMYIVTSELARSGSRAIVSVSASCAVTLLAMDAAPAVAEETRVSIPSQTTTYTLSGATPFVVETDNTIATDTAASAAIVGDNSNDWDLLIESGAVVGSSLTDSQAMNLDSLTGATSVHNQGTITGSNEDGTILLQNGGSVINDARIENSATYEHDPEDIPQEYAGVYMLNGGSYVSSESGVLEGVSGVIVQSGEAHITNGGMINSDGSWRSYGVEFRDGTYGTIVNTGTIITTASDGSNKIEDAAIYVHTLNDMAVSGSVSVDNSGLMQSDFITVALYHGSHFEVVNRVGGVITAGNSSLVGIKSTAMELKVGVDNLVTNDGTISAYGTANTYGIHYGESTSGGVITNTGSITTTGGGAGDASVYVHGNGDGTVVNNSGTMSSTVYGVYLDSARSKGHTLNNQAGGAISANTAVAINGNGNTITNQGKMTGVSDGLLISGNNNIVTTSGGEISGKNGIRVSKGSGNQITAKSGSKITTTSTGISIAGGNNQITTESGSAIVAKDNGILINSGANNVTNGGSITATGSSISYGIHYYSGASGTITNTGTITTTGKGAGDASVYAHGGAVTINNSGTMDSSVFGVYVTTGHTLNNLAGGSITANTAVQLNGNNNTLANAGAILGDTNGVTISGSGNTLTSQGKITGGTNAILINSGSKNNTLTLNTGTEMSGSITDGNNSASANNNLILDGEGTLGSSISGLNSVTSSGDWTLSGATMNLSGTTNSALWVKSGTLILNGAMTAKGATVDSGTTLQIGNSGTLGAFNGDIVDNGTLTFNRSDAAVYGSVISGSGNVVKQGGGELTLSNNNSYSGGTTIAEGTLTATAGGALGSGNIDNRAYLKLEAASASDPFIVADLTTHSGATVEIGAGSTLQANTLTQQDGSTLTADLTATSGPATRAKNVNLDGTLNVASPASQEPIRSTDDLISLALIESDNAISGDFDDITINGNAMNPDAFITVVGQKNVNDTHYDLVETLTWYADRDNAAIDAHGTFNLADADDSFTVNTVLENVDANSGWNGQSLTKTGAGTLILGAQNTYSGDTDVQEGTLWLAETATIGSAGSAQAVNIAANAAFGGHNATVNGHVNNLGSLYFVDTFTVNGDVVNSSAMISGSDQPNNTLTIAGNYTGNDGHLYLNTQLGDDSSPTDKLIVTGDTAGSTTLHITNVNGLGAQTVNGIEVIEVGGQSDGDFTLYKGHVDINAWTYTLKQDGGDWYLRSESDDVPDDGGDVTPPDDGGEVTPPDDGGDVTPPDDGGEVTPPDDGGDVTPPDDGGDVSPPDDGGDVTPPDDGGDITPPDDGGDITPPDGGDVTPVAPQYRADIGVYLGNQWMARNLQMQTLYDREGSQYRSADGSIWMRFKAGKAESQAVNGNVDIDSDYSQFQLGGDILTWSDGAQSVTVGLMGSYINASTDSTGNRGADGSQFSANGSVDGYNLGLYATWFADAQSHRGAYIDSWYQYGAYNNSVDNDGLSASRYDSAAHAVSLETGYRYDIALSNRNTVSLTPQAQVTWQRYSADTVIDDGGTRISGQNDDSWTTRLGVRVDGKLYKESGRIQPFMEVNWLHASDNASATFGDTKVSQDLPNDRVEVKVGIQANVSERLSVYAQAAGQKGKNDYGDASFSLNMRYNW
ncbi:ShdA [Salmonella enterica subsp. enterica serovar Anecho]|nr:ShdA [Salmonella enterica subsp. enterica serovar Anecho]